MRIGVSQDNDYICGVVLLYKCSSKRFAFRKKKKVAYAQGSHDAPFCFNFVSCFSFSGGESANTPTHNTHNCANLFYKKRKTDRHLQPRVSKFYYQKTSRVEHHVLPIYAAGLACANGVSSAKAPNREARSTPSPSLALANQAFHCGTESFSHGTSRRHPWPKFVEILYKRKQKNLWQIKIEIHGIIKIDCFVVAVGTTHTTSEVWCGPRRLHLLLLPARAKNILRAPPHSFPKLL